MNILVTILTAIGSFIAGWLLATDKNRHEVFKTKLSVYMKLNQSLSETLMLKLKRQVFNDETKTEYFKSHLKTSECFVSHSFIIPSKVGNEIANFLKINHDDIEAQRKTFNLIVNKMSSDMKLDEINFINEVINLPLYKLVKKQETKNKTNILVL